MPDLIMGIDPGSRRTGWGVISNQEGKMKALGFGVIDLPEPLSLEKRLAQLTTELTEIIKKFQPRIMAVEKIFLGKNPDSAFKLGHARGVALAVAGTQGLRVREYATRHIKKMLTGSGGATKEQVQFMIFHSLGVRTVQLDATDALAVAVCAGREFEVMEIFERGQM